MYKTERKRMDFMDFIIGEILTPKNLHKERRLQKKMNHIYLSPKKKGVGGNEDPISPYWKLESNKNMQIIRLSLNL